MCQAQLFSVGESLPWHLPRMQLSHPVVPAGQVGTLLGVGLGDHVCSPQCFL